jgi:sigma-E factor negative regulatory protein RseB
MATSPHAEPGPARAGLLQRLATVALAGAGLLTGLLAGAACAAGPVAPESPSAHNVERSDAGWLQAIQEAAQRQSFLGTVVVRRGGEVHATRVYQSWDGTTSRERVLALDGPPREFLREGETLQCLYPREHRVVIEEGARPRSFPAIAAVRPAEILANYTLRTGGVERVAGTPCRVLDLLPRDHLRYGYRLWVEPASGLLLKAQTLDEHAAVIEQAAFSEVRLGEALDPSLLRASWSTEGWQFERRESQAAQHALEGWRITPPSGFHRLAEVARNLARFRDAPPRPTFQTVYSDGLATVSVFIEPGPAVGEAPGHALRRGPVTAVSRQLEEARVTVVGEVPPETARALAESVVHEAAVRTAP